MGIDDLVSSGALEPERGIRAEFGASGNSAAEPCDTGGKNQRCIDSDEDTNEPLNVRTATERNKGAAWGEAEHRMFLLGLKKLGKGDWRGISRHYVSTRTPTQVASHAQKHFIRQSTLTKRKRRSSLFDITTDFPQDSSGNGTSMTHYGPPLGCFMPPQQYSGLPAPSMQTISGATAGTSGMESYLTSSQAQAYQEAAAMQAVAAQEAFVASINEAQASQTVQLMQQAALAGISLSPAQAAEMAQQATLYAQQAFAQQQTAMYLQAQVQQQQAMAMMQGWAPLGVPPYMGMPSMSMGASKPSQTEGAIFQSTAAFNQLPTPFAQPPPLPPHVGGAMSAAAGQEAIEEEFRRWQRANAMPQPYREEAEVQGGDGSSDAGEAFGHGKLFRPTASHASLDCQVLNALPLYPGSLNRSGDKSPDGVCGFRSGSSREGSDQDCSGFKVARRSYASSDDAIKWQPSQLTEVSVIPSFQPSEACVRSGTPDTSGNVGSGVSFSAASL